jgi:hypothetical protein
LNQLRALWLLVVGILVWTMVFAGCSGSSTIAITLSPASGESLNPGATVTVTATLTNDKNNQGVTWTLTGPGTLSSNTTTSVVYTAPSTISTNTTATITATSVANSSITATESITLNAVLTITTTSLPAGALGVPYGPTFVNAAGATGTFTWTITSGSLPAGLTFLTTSTSSSAQISGTPTLLETSKFTVQVTDSAGNSVTQALSITINPPPPLSVATGSLPNGTVNTSYTATLHASSGTPPYSWSLTGGSLPFGLALNSQSGAISGTPVATGTYSFTVQVADSSTPQQSATATLSITINQGTTDNSRLKGNYAFSVRGFDINGLFVAAGSFVADGSGNISTGVMDINDTAAGLLPINETFSGTYSIGQEGLGFMAFNILTGGTGSRSFALSMMANDNANIIEFDDSTGGFINNTARNSGVLIKQDPTAFSGAPEVGNYAFGFVGIDSLKSRFGVAGSFASTGNGSLTGVSLDSDDAGTLFSGSSLSGSSTPVDSSGRGTMTLPTAHGSAIYSFYVVSATEMLVVGIDTFAPGGNPLVSGTILQQAGSSDFNAASVFELTALNGSTAQSQVGQFVAVSGSFTLTSDENLGGTLTQPTGTGGYTITQPSGRVAVTPSSTGSGFQNTTPTSPQPVLYMVNTNNVEAFIIGTDPAVSFGIMAAQQGVSLSGTYAGGSLAPVDSAVSNVVSVAIAGSNTLDVTADVSNANGLSQSQVSETTTPPDAQGRVVVTENSNTAEILYLISPTQFFALDALSTDPTARVDIFQQ